MAEIRNAVLEKNGGRGVQSRKVTRVRVREVEVLPVADLSGKSAFQFFFVGDATQVSRTRRHNTKKQRKYSENHTGQAGQTTSEIGNSLAGPGRHRVDWNLSDLVGLGPVILKISPAGPGAGWARRHRPGPARPHLRELAPPAKTVEFEI